MSTAFSRSAVRNAPAECFANFRSIHRKSACIFRKTVYILLLLKKIQQEIRCLIPDYSDYHVEFGRYRLPELFRNPIPRFRNNHKSGPGHPVFIKKTRQPNKYRRNNRRTEFLCRKQKYPWSSLREKRWRSPPANSLISQTARALSAWATPAFSPPHVPARHAKAPISSRFRSTTVKNSLRQDVFPADSSNAKDAPPTKKFSQCA